VCSDDVLCYEQCYGVSVCTDVDASTSTEVYMYMYYIYQDVHICDMYMCVTV
jgi:hypothetical protein